VVSNVSAQPFTLDGELKVVHKEELRQGSPTNPDGAWAIIGHRRMGMNTMHERLVYEYIVRRLRSMTDKQLDAVRRDCLFVCEQAMKVAERKTGRPFEEVFEERLAEQLRSDPQALPELRRILAERQQPRRKRNRHDYFDEAWPNRDKAEDRWRAITGKIAEVQFPRCPSWEIENRVACSELPKLPGMRVAELIAYAELHAGCQQMGWPNPLEGHLREQKIDGLASFITKLCDPMAGTAEPLEAVGAPAM
jgi:hypothetical protein